METFLYTLAFAAISSAAWMAFKEPRLYRFFFPGVMSVIYAIFLGCIVWDMSATSAASAAHSAIYEMRGLEAKSVVVEAIDNEIAKGRPPMLWVFVVTIGLSLYLGFLSVIPDLRQALGTKDNRD